MMRRDWRWIWNLSCPTKIKIFLWQCMWGRVACNENINRIMPHHSKYCSFCPQKIESMDHNFGGLFLSPRFPSMSGLNWKSRSQTLLTL